MESGAELVRNLTTRLVKRLYLAIGLTGTLNLNLYKNLITATTSSNWNFPNCTWEKYLGGLHLLLIQCSKMIKSNFQDILALVFETI